MTTVRVMPGLADLTGTKVGTLRVERMVSRQPEPRYAVVCDKCGAKSAAIHTRLRNGAAKCMNAACGKPVTKRATDLMREHRERIALREAERLAEDIEASELRMQADVDSQHWERQEAERRSAKERRDDEARHAAEAAQNERKEKQRVYWREAVEDFPDPKFVVTPELLTASMPKAKADSHNIAEIEKFCRDTPSYAAFKTPENADRILAYFARNGVTIFDAAMLKAAFDRLRDLCVLTEKPKSVEQPKRVNLLIEHKRTEAATEPKKLMGRDQRTGEIREFSRWESDHMSADEFKRTFVTPKLSDLSEG